MNLCRSRGLFNYSIILLLTLLFNRKIAADRCIHDPKRILTDLVEQGEELLNFKPNGNFPANTVLEYLNNLITKDTDFDNDINMKEIWRKLGVETVGRRLGNQSAEYIQNSLRLHVNPCAEILQHCEGDLSFDPNTTNVEAENVPVLKRRKDDLGDETISPFKLSRKSLDDAIQTLYDYEEDINETEMRNHLISTLVIQSVGLLLCKVKNSRSKKTIFQFSYFTTNESGYPKFIIKSISRSNKKYSYISAELLAPNRDNASSSTS